MKAHTHETKERINELSNLLIENNILIQLANSDVKEFSFKWHLIHEEAARKLQSLDAALNDVQNWDRKVNELNEWISYMDKYLSTRIEQEIFADDVPDDFNVIIWLNFLYLSIFIKVFFIFSVYGMSLPCTN